jgi:hypothetical protein
VSAFERVMREHEAEWKEWAADPDAWARKLRPDPRPEARRVRDPWPNLLGTQQGCDAVARELLDRRMQMPREAVREFALDVLQNVADFGFLVPFELVDLLRLELKVKPTGVTTKPQYQRALAVARAKPGISVRALAAEVGVPWPTVGRWVRQPYWKLAVTLK